MPEPKKNNDSAIIDDYQVPSGATEVKQNKIMSFKEDVKVGQYVVGRFARVETRQIDGRKTQVLLFTAKNGDEFGLGCTAVIKSAMEGQGVTFGDPNSTPPVPENIKPLQGKVVVIKNLGIPPKKRYADLQIWFADKF